jgi:pimeloyl-ACP methyl ester carboxylesterase
MMPDEWEKLAAAIQRPCTRIAVRGRPGFVLEPPAPAPGKPWVLYAPAFEGLYPTERQAWIFSRVIAGGISVAGVDIGESWGSPAGRSLLDAWYELMVRSLGLSRTPVLLPQSRGGLMLYTWAAGNPGKTAGVTGIYTVCDIRSYPGVEKACEAYGMSPAELAACLDAHNPVDTLAPLAAAGVPLWHIHGDKDEVVPMDANAGELVKRYRAMGAPADLLVVPGLGHEEHALFFERQEVVESICRQALR